MINQQLYPLVLLFVFLTSCNGQKKPPLSEDIQEINKLSLLPMKQNVPLDTASQISEYVVETFEDTKGNLWFETMSDGAARYDGKVFTHFTTQDGLCNNDVGSILEDKNGNIWFGTEGGVCRYYGKAFNYFKSL